MYQTRLHCIPEDSNPQFNRNCSVVFMYPVSMYMQNFRMKLKYLFVQILAELETRHGEPEYLQTAFIKQLYSCHFPGPGQSLKLSMANTSHSVAGEGRQ